MKTARKSECLSCDVNCKHLQARTPDGASQTVLERVRALETKLPGLQEKLQPFSRPGDAERVASAAAGGGSLVARVEALEEAVKVLLTAQVDY
jgi:hypothetical protein